MIVIEASNCAEALAMCGAEMPDILVIDAALEEMRTGDFIRSVRSLEAPIAPQILVSLVEVDIGAIMRAKRAGAHGYLLKPFNRAQLIERFRTLDIAA
jgi:two-component system chemotaxis response regulator CheY